MQHQHAEFALEKCLPAFYVYQCMPNLCFYEEGCLDYTAKKDEGNKRNERTSRLQRQHFKQIVLKDSRHKNPFGLLTMPKELFWL